MAGGDCDLKANLGVGSRRLPLVQPADGCVENADSVAPAPTRAQATTVPADLGRGNVPVDDVAEALAVAEGEAWR